MQKATVLTLSTIVVIILLLVSLLSLLLFFRGGFGRAAGGVGAIGGKAEEQKKLLDVDATDIFAWSWACCVHTESDSLCYELIQDSRGGIGSRTGAFDDKDDCIHECCKPGTQNYCSPDRIGGQVNDCRRLRIPSNAN